MKFAFNISITFYLNVSNDIFKIHFYNSPLMKAVILGYVDIIKTFLNHSGINLADEDEILLLY